MLPLHLYGRGVECVGTDISAEQIAAAKALAAERNAPIQFFACPAEELPFADGTFDAVTAAQCFWYFDRAKIVPEIRRVLKPGGVFVKVYMNWMLTDPIARASCRLVKRLNPAWTSGATAYRDVFNHPFPGGAFGAVLNSPVVVKIHIAQSFTVLDSFFEILDSQCKGLCIQDTFAL